MADISDEDTLVRRRSRRSTAGNRMEAALAEMAALHPEPEMEVDDDKDFIGPADEDEIFDSDFQSTDEESAQDDGIAVEKEITAEEKQARRSVRQRAVKAVEARIATYGPAPKTVVSTDTPAKSKVKAGRGLRRVSKGGALDSEIGEALSKRKSRRQSTMLSSQILSSRLKDAEEKKALMPKRSREVSVTYTQAELLARALDTEEGNIVSHRNYLEDEEEKRKRARVMKQKLTGPILSWVSRLEDEKVPVEPASAVKPSSITYAYTGYGPHSASTSAAVGGYSAYQPYGAAPLPSSYFAPSAALQALSQPPEQATPARTERVSKNYLVHKGDEDMAKPDWGETMSTVFGSHVKWEEVKVYSGKHRPLSRPVNKCPLTGRTAIYRDPRSGVPFANVNAFKILSRILTHEYVWNEELRCYTADEKATQVESVLDEATDALPVLSTS